MPPIDGPTLTLFDAQVPDVQTTPRRARRARHDDAGLAIEDASDDTLTEQPWPDGRRRGTPRTEFQADAAPAPVVIPETCLSLLRANDRQDLPCPLVANAYRLVPGEGDAAAQLLAKVNAPQRLREALRRPGLVARPIQLGTLADPYLDAERELRITRALLAVLAEARHPVGLVTGSAAVVRDLDLLAGLASRGQALVLMRIPTACCPLDLCSEPTPAEPVDVGATRGRGRPRRSAEPVPGAAQRERLAASPWLRTIERLSAAGVPVGVLLDLVTEGLEASALRPPDADPARRLAWQALFAQLKTAGASLWRTALPSDRLDDALALADLAADAGLDGRLPNLDSQPFTPPAAHPVDAASAQAPRQVALF